MVNLNDAVARAGTVIAAVTLACPKCNLRWNVSRFSGGRKAFPRGFARCPKCKGGNGTTVALSPVESTYLRDVSNLDAPTVLALREPPSLSDKIGAPEVSQHER